jgi:hypothetical protein
MRLIPFPVVLLLIYIIIPGVSAGNVPYTAKIYAPANLAIGIDAPSSISLGSSFSVIANLSNRGTENALNVSAELIFLDWDNMMDNSRLVFIYSEPVKRIGSIPGTNFKTVTWKVKTRNAKKDIGNYSILIRARGKAEISGEELAEEEQKKIVLKSKWDLFSFDMIFSEFVQNFSWPPTL